MVITVVTKIKCILLAVLRRNLISNELAGLILRRHWAYGQHGPFQKTIAAMETVGHTMSDFTGQRFKLKTSRSRDKRVIALLNGRY